MLSAHFKKNSAWSSSVTVPKRYGLTPSPPWYTSRPRGSGVALHRRCARQFHGMDSTVRGAMKCPSATKYTKERSLL